MPHLDVLHPARRFWKPRTGLTPASGSAVDARELERLDDLFAAALERQPRRAAHGDVPGFEIPARYFQFVRSGDARPLAAVLEHNRLDLLSLAALTARLLHLARSGPDGARDAREALALGHVYARGRARRTRARRATAARSSAAARRAAPTIRSASRRCARWRSRAAARGSMTKRRRAGASCSRCAAARRRSSAKRPRRSRFITSTACAISPRRRRLRCGDLEGERPGWTACGAASVARLERKMVQVRSEKSEVEVEA